MADAAIKAYKNISNHFHLGRPKDWDKKEVKPYLCPHIAPGGHAMHMKPGDVIYDRVGIMGMMQNAANNFTIFARGPAKEILAELEALRLVGDLEEEKKKLAEKQPSDSLVHFEQVGDVLTVVVRGMLGIIEDVTKDYGDSIEATTDRIESLKAYTDLEKKLKARDAEIELLKKSIHADKTPPVDGAAAVAKASAPKKPGA